VHLIKLSLHGTVLRAEVYQSKQKKDCNQYTRLLQKVAEIMKQLGPRRWLSNALLDLALVSLERIDKSTCISSIFLSLLIGRVVCALIGLRTVLLQLNVIKIS